QGGRAAGRRARRQEGAPAGERGIDADPPAGRQQEVGLGVLVPGRQRQPGPRGQRGDRMTRPELLAYVASLGPAARELFEKADRTAAEAADALGEESQLAAGVVALFERRAAD